MIKYIDKETLELLGEKETLSFKFNRPGYVIIINAVEYVVCNTELLLTKDVSILKV